MTFVERLTLALFISVLGLPAVCYSQSDAPGDSREAMEADGAAPKRKTLSLEDCLRTALLENLDIQYQEASTAMARHSLSSARGAFLPTLNASTNYDDSQPEKRTSTVSISQGTPWGTSFSASTTQTRGTTADSTSAAISITQPLLREAGPSNSFASYRQARIYRDAAEERLGRKLQDVIYQVKTRYYNTARLMETVKVRRQAVERAQRLLGEAAFKRKRGMVTVLDHANAVIQLADRESSYISVQKRLEDALDDLKQSLHFPLDDPIAIEPISLELQSRVSVNEDEGTVSVGGEGGSISRVIFRPVPRNYRLTIKETLEQRPDLKAADLDLEAKKLEVDRKRNQMRHDLDLTFNYYASGGEHDELRHLPDEEWSAKLSFSWPIGRLSRRASYERARLSYDMQLIVVEKLRVGIRKEILRLFRRLEETELNILTYAKKISAAAQALESAKIRKERGHTSYWEVTARESDLLNAQTSFINAYLDYKTRLAELDRSCGYEVTVGDSTDVDE